MLGITNSLDKYTPSNIRTASNQETKYQPSSSLSEAVQRLPGRFKTGFVAKAFLVRLPGFLFTLQQFESVALT